MNSKLKIQSLAAAVALACAAQAGAVSLVGYNEADANTVTLRLAGATASDTSILQMMRLTTSGSQFCQANTLDVYRLNSDNYRIFACTGGVQSGLNGKKIVVIRNGEYGSGSGASTLVKGLTPTTDINTALVESRFPDVNSATIQGAPATSTVAASGSFASYVLHNITTSTGLLATVASDAGITDAEPNQFKNVFVPSLTASELSKLTVKGISGVIFGVPVTNNIYQRLQALQFATSSTCHPANAGYVGLGTAGSPANSEACMPSLSRDAIGAIYSGAVSDWSDIKSAQNSTETAASVDLTGDSTPEVLADTGIYIERRVASSGTQVTAEVHFLNQRCNAGAGTFVKNSENPTYVRENPGSSDVRTSLAARQDANQGAIGVLSTESVPAATSSTAALTKFRFIKINGAAPNVLNVVKGSYDYFYESTLQYRASAVGGVAALSGNKKILADKMVTLVGNPTTVALINAGFTQLFGRAGLVANAVTYGASLAATPITSAGTDAAPVAGSTRGVTGSPNACLTPTRLGGLQAGI